MQSDNMLLWVCEGLWRRWRGWSVSDAATKNGQPVCLCACVYFSWSIWCSWCSLCSSLQFASPNSLSISCFSWSSATLASVTNKANPKWPSGPFLPLLCSCPMTFAPSVPNTRPFCSTGKWLQWTRTPWASREGGSTRYWAPPPHQARIFSHEVYLNLKFNLLSTYLLSFFLVQNNTFWTFASSIYV